MILRQENGIYANLRCVMNRSETIHPGGASHKASRMLSACLGDSARRFALIALSLASLAFLPACSPVDSAGTIPRSNIRTPRAPHRLSVKREMLFEYGENPVEKKTVLIPKGDYVFEGEDDVFLYFRSPEPLEYRVYHKEGFAEGFFQLGGLALSLPSTWDEFAYPICAYTDGEKPNQKRLTCPLEPTFIMQRRWDGDWDSDFDAE